MALLRLSGLLGKIICCTFMGLLLCCAETSYSQNRINYRNVPVVDSAVGYASFYANKFVGRKTASGEVFRQDRMTCAHNTLPLGTLVRVTNLSNSKSVVVRVNDRLHHRNARLVDLTTKAARQLGLQAGGIVKVRVEVVKVQDPAKE